MLIHEGWHLPCNGSKRFITLQPVHSSPPETSVTVIQRGKTIPEQCSYSFLFDRVLVSLFFQFPPEIGEREHQLILTTTCFKWLETTNLMFVRGDFLLSMVNQHENTPFGGYFLCFPTAKQANTSTYLILQEPKQIYPAFSLKAGRDFFVKQS